MLRKCNLHFPEVPPSEYGRDYICLIRGTKVSYESTTMKPFCINSRAVVPLQQRQSFCVGETMGKQGAKGRFHGFNVQGEDKVLLSPFCWTDTMPNFERSRCPSAQCEGLC